MSVVACTSVGSVGGERSPSLGMVERTPRAVGDVYDRNLAALARRGECLLAASTGDSPTPANEATAPSDEHVATWLSTQPAFREARVPPVVVAGLRSTAMLRGIWQATRVARDGYSPRLWVVEPEASRAAAGLSECDLTQIIDDERVGFLIGSGAIDRLRRALFDRLDTTMQHACVGDDGSASGTAAEVKRVLDEAASAQERAQARLRARVAAIYAERDAAWWSRRFHEATHGGEPLRVLLPSCRYTTFVQHAAGDLARAFERRGMQAEVLVERDAHSRLSAHAYLERIATLRPDLIVLINYPRVSLGLDMPRNIPVVCWIQDAMPHLFDAKVGKSQSAYDFVMGHVFPELYDQFGYAMGRTMPAVVVADGSKFHRGDVPLACRERCESEIALVSHHSETPEAMHERLKGEVGKDAGMVRVLEALRPRIERIVRESDEGAPIARLKFEAAASWREQIGDEPPARALALLSNNYALPLADRMLRHQTIEWAREIAVRRGWRLALYGRGWSNNPQHAEFARGELPHGEELRAVYASASVHLHVSLTTLVHQRVIECLLSGGACLLRLTRDSISGARTTLARTLLSRPADVTEQDRLGYVIADHPEAMAFAALAQRLGQAGTEGVHWIPRAKAEAIRRRASLQAPEQDANWAFGDLSEIGFASKQRLEALVERAICAPGWRRNVSSMSSRRVGEHLTHDALMGRLIAFVGKGFHDAAQVERPGA